MFWTRETRACESIAFQEKLVNIFEKIVLKIESRKSKNHVGLIIKNYYSILFGTNVEGGICKRSAIYSRSGGPGFASNQGMMRFLYMNYPT